MFSIEAENLSKTFRICKAEPTGIKHRFVSLFRGEVFEYEDFPALRNIDLKVDVGSSIGLIGRNGSGKSTLLKIIARILTPDSGTVVTHGRLSALLELGTGFHPELTGMENIYLNSSILGFSRKEIEDRIPDIIRFSELGRFINMPIKSYSSGMYMRLGFSVAVYVQPDILLIDEILAVGDEAFQTKCKAKIGEFRERGTTIVFVSHDTEAVGALCDRAVWLEAGIIRADGPSRRVIGEYQRFLDDGAFPAEMGQTDSDPVVPPDKPAPFMDQSPSRRYGTEVGAIEYVRFVDSSETDPMRIAAGEEWRIEIGYNFRESEDNPVFGVALHTLDGIHICGPNTKIDGIETGRKSGRGAIRLRFPKCRFAPGKYCLTAVIYNKDISRPIDHNHKGCVIDVLPGPKFSGNGLLDLETEWEI